MSTIRVRRQTLQSLWGSAFASGATTGQPVQELEWKTRRVKKRETHNNSNSILTLLLLILLIMILVILLILLILLCSNSSVNSNITNTINVLPLEAAGDKPGSVFKPDAKAPDTYK